MTSEDVKMAEDKAHRAGRQAAVVVLVMIALAAVFLFAGCAQYATVVKIPHEVTDIDPKIVKAQEPEGEANFWSFMQAIPDAFGSYASMVSGLGKAAFGSGAEFAKIFYGEAIVIKTQDKCGSVVIEKTVEYVDGKPKAVVKVHFKKE